MFEWFIKKMKKNNKGFTLIELVVVIAILGILAGIAVPRYSKSRENAAIAAHNANVRTLESAATLAVSEGSGKITWNGDETEKKTDGKLPDNAWENYIQDWPEFPKGLVGKKVKIEVVTVEGNDQKISYEVKPITGEEVYKVAIDENGGIIVTPGKIKDDE